MIAALQVQLEGGSFESEDVAATALAQSAIRAVAESIPEEMFATLAAIWGLRSKIDPTTFDFRDFQCGPVKDTPA